MEDLRLYTLSEAAKILGGGVTKDKLSTEIRRGNLEYTRIGASKLVTVSQLQEMMERCRVQAKAQGSTQGDMPGTAKTSGLSGTTARTQAQAACSASLKMLRENLRNTSRKNGRRPAGKVSSRGSHAQTS